MPTLTIFHPVALALLREQVNEIGELDANDGKPVGAHHELMQLLRHDIAPVVFEVGTHHTGIIDRAVRNINDPVFSDDPPLVFPSRKAAIEGGVDHELLDLFVFPGEIVVV